MRRTRWRAGLTTAGLVPLLLACEADSTGPDGAELPIDLVTVRIESILVPGDCDPALDNPGDFQGWVEIWQDVNRAADVTEYKQVVASPKRVEAIDRRTALVLDDEMQVQTSVVRDQFRPVSVRAIVNELDDGVIDVGISQEHTLSWSPTADCWINGGECLPPASGAFVGLWSREEFFRIDVFDLFNPDDESCRFTVNFTATIDMDQGQ
jgi:hypothetical protein